MVPRGQSYSNLKNSKPFHYRQVILDKSTEDTGEKTRAVGNAKGPVSTAPHMQACSPAGSSSALCSHSARAKFPSVQWKSKQNAAGELSILQMRKSAEGPVTYHAQSQFLTLQSGEVTLSFRHGVTRLLKDTCRKGRSGLLPANNLRWEGNELKTLRKKASVSILKGSLQQYSNSFALKTKTFSLITLK